MDKNFIRSFVSDSYEHSSVGWKQFQSKLTEEELDELAQRYLFSSERNVDNISFEQYVEDYLARLATQTPVRPKR